MELYPFIQFTLNTKFIKRWVVAGLIFFIPFLDFFSVGYLSRAIRIMMTGGMGLPTWDRKGEIWMEGLKQVFLFILYEAVPFFLFSFGFFLTALHPFTAFFGRIITFLGFVALFIFSFFIPFAFAVLAEKMDFKKALEFDTILKAIKEVIILYVAGYLGILFLIGVFYVTILKIPYFIGFFLFSILTYYVLILGAYYFAQLFVRTSLSTVRITEDVLRDV
ncbi:MAG TPA: DUF4013 domain-containing protein [Syntrophorhabdaceae bacterium]|nr:DUF4013 domain-containing protein [Syntrophorhabdaceae bacterium]HPP05886.1 DUF4013 domain-containing protein [Syntrophorhabdaceae bacterium]